MPDEISLAEIAAREAAATPGPWCTDAWEIYQGTEYMPGLSMWIGETCRGETTCEQDRADAAFVAAARQDVPDLLAEVIRLREQLAKVAEFCAQRAEYITAIENVSPGNRADYWRWQGHAAARRQLSQQLDLPVGWPVKAEAKAVASDGR